MNPDVKNQAAGALKTVWGCTKIFTSNIMRRALILGRYTLICGRQQRLRRAQRRLGGVVLQALEQGEVNPMLTEAVKDALAKAKAIKAGKDKHYQAIAGLREKIRTACACESPAKPAEPRPGEGPSGPEGS
jgi:hypothetical protein